MTRFASLVRREWLQHRVGWCVLMVAPTLVLLALSAVDGGLQLRVNADDITLPPLRAAPAAVQTALLTAAAGGATLLLACLAVLFQLPGLARRDQQDRSIEFWCSLPIGHAQSVAAALLTHLLLLPAAALLAGMAGAQLAALVTIGASHGLAAWLGQPWPVLLMASAAMLLRLWLGLVLAVAWLSPLLLLTMAASAWLGRWGLPLVAAALLALPKLVDPRLPAPWFGPALRSVTGESLAALAPLQAWHGFDPGRIEPSLAALPGALLRDAAQAAERAATPGMAVALALAALGFWLLVLRRRRAL